MNAKKLDLFFNSSSMLKSYFGDGLQDIVNKFKDKIKNNYYDDKEVMSNELVIIKENNLYHDEESYESIDQALETLTEASINLNAEIDSPSHYIDQAAIIVIQASKLEDLRKKYSDLKDRFENQKIDLDKSNKEKEIWEQKYKQIINQNIEKEEKKLNQENTKCLSFRREQPNRSTSFIKIEGNTNGDKTKSYKVGMDNRMDISSRDTFRRNMQSTINDRQENGFLLADLLECRDFNMDGTPNMRMKENREKFLESGKNIDGSKDMRYKANKERQSAFFRKKYRRLAGLPSDSENEDN